MVFPFSPNDYNWDLPAPPVADGGQAGRDWDSDEVPSIFQALFEGRLSVKDGL